MSYVRTVDPLPGAHGDKWLLLRADPHQLGLELALAPLQVVQDKRRGDALHRIVK